MHEQAEDAGGSVSLEGNIDRSKEQGRDCGDVDAAFPRLPKATRLRVVSRRPPTEPGKAVSCKYWSKVK